MKNTLFWSVVVVCLTVLFIAFFIWPTPYSNELCGPNRSWIARVTRCTGYTKTWCPIQDERDRQRAIKKDQEQKAEMVDAVISSLDRQLPVTEDEKIQRLEEKKDEQKERDNDNWWSGFRVATVWIFIGWATFYYFRSDKFQKIRNRHLPKTLDNPIASPETH